jgi:predicted dehydrogenase
MHVLADKPMVIDVASFAKLREAFTAAESRGVLLYDIMTERYEITSLVQKALSMEPEIFGHLENGTPDDPAVVLRSVHHFFKYVAGRPIVRPTWFFDPSQQGEAIVDVGTHLIDLVQWMCFPETVLDTADVEVLSARRWPTVLSPEAFARVTGGEDIPTFLERYVNDGKLHVFQNNETTYRLRGVHAYVAAEWAYEAEEGGDVHFSRFRGSKSELEIRQGAPENWRPEIYVKLRDAKNADGFEDILGRTVKDLPYQDLSITRSGANEWRVNIPDNLRVGHEAHFAQVTEKYLGFLQKGTMPDWEVPNMLVKYWTTTRALELARNN